MRNGFASALTLLSVAGLAIAACGSDADDAGATGGAGGKAADGGIETGSGASGGTGGTGATGGGSGGTGGGDGGIVCPPDEDGDNIPDSIEGKAEARDSDGDGTLDFQDTDSDGDSVPDRIEADTASVGCNVPLDSDGDGTPNHLDEDSDDNGILDRDEIYPDGAAYDPGKAPSDSDGDNVPDLYTPDNDGDSFDDEEELVSGQAVDTDGDGLPDHDDPDSDGDTIGDEFETFADGPDNDGKPNARDLDSDNDTVLDACEAGPNHQLADPPADSDLDGRYDIIDFDSDNDGLKDGLEDKNSDCVVNLGETDRALTDTDGDGATDLIEVHLGSNPTNAAERPQTLGRYYFVMPHNQNPLPVTEDVVLKTNLNKGDIAFIVDATGTMGGAISSMKAELVEIMNSIKAEVPDARFGVMSHEDYPIDPYGSLGNLPVRLPGSGNQAYLTNVAADTTAAVQSLTTRDGADFAESQIAAMWKALTNGLLTWPSGGTQAAFSPPNGGFGALGFRSDALPVLIAVTDGAFHNGKYVGTTTMHDTYSFNGQAPGPPPTVDTLVTAMNSRGAKIVGVALDGGGPARGNKNPYRDLAYIVDATKSYVQPSAFGQGETLCATDIAGGKLSPDGIGSPPSCRLIFSVYANGAGTSKTIQDGVKALLRGIKMEVRILAASVQPPNLVCSGSGTPKLVDAVDDFIDHIQVFEPGQLEDPAELGTKCETLDINDLRDWYDGPRGVLGAPPPNDNPDSYNETATNVTPGIRVCFKVVPKRNTICPQKADVQLVKATLTVKARNEGQSEELDVGQPREVFFVIPPLPQ